MKHLLSQIRNCTHCKEHLPLGPRPIVAADRKSKIVIVGQAPGIKVHQTGIPWDDASGRQLRSWLGVSDKQFYDRRLFALVPMGFCYPGKGKLGDLPPRPECAPQWHTPLMDQMPDIRLTILLGVYAQKHYLGDAMKINLTENVESYRDFLPDYLPLPHPSPRNRFWLGKNLWFEQEVLPELRKRVSEILTNP